MNGTLGPTSNEKKEGLPVYSSSLGGGGLPPDWYLGLGMSQRIMG